MHEMKGGGNPLEPFQKWDHAYLQATCNVLKTATLSYPDDSVELKVLKINSLDTASPGLFWSMMIPIYNLLLPHPEETLRCVLTIPPYPLLQWEESAVNPSVVT
jgi:hypothetical protein